MKSAGLLQIRRKLPEVPKIKPIPSGDNIPPLPDKLKLRHPLGISYDDKIRKKSKKYHSIKKKIRS